MDTVGQKTHEDIKKQKSKSHFYTASNGVIKQTFSFVFLMV